jgi:hypothetical protein
LITPQWNSVENDLELERVEGGLKRLITYSRAPSTRPTQHFQSAYEAIEFTGIANNGFIEATVTLFFLISLMRQVRIIHITRIEEVEKNL